MAVFQYCNGSCKVFILVVCVNLKLVHACTTLPSSRTLEPTSEEVLWPCYTLVFWCWRNSCKTLVHVHSNLDNSFLPYRLKCTVLISWKPCLVSFPNWAWFWLETSPCYIVNTTQDIPTIHISMVSDTAFFWGFTTSGYKSDNGTIKTNSKSFSQVCSHKSE